MDAAQTGDAHVHAAVKRRVLQTAHRVQQNITRQQTARLLHEHTQQLELALGQHDFPLMQPELMRFLVHTKRTLRQPCSRFFLRALASRRSTQYGAYARQQLTRIERLGQVIIRAHLKTDDAIQILATRGKHDDRRITLRTQPPGKRQAILARQHQIQQKHVRHPAFAQSRLKRCAIGQPAHRKALLAQIAHQQRT